MHVTDISSLIRIQYMASKNCNSESSQIPIQWNKFVQCSG